MIRADLYLPGNTWLHRADARVKLLLVATGPLLLLLYQNLILALAGLLALGALLASAGLGWHQLRPALLPLLPVSLLMFALRALFHPAGSALSQVGPVVLTDLGLAAGAVVALRILALALLVVGWLVTTTQRDAVRSLVWVGLPYSWGLAFTLALRFLPDMALSYQTIERAQRARGLLIEGERWGQRLQAMQPVFIAMIVRSLRRSEEMALALEARGFSAAGACRTDLHPLRFRRADWVLAGAVMVLLTLGVGAFFGLGLGRQPWLPLV